MRDQKKLQYHLFWLRKGVKSFTEFTKAKETQPSSLHTKLCVLLV